ncbi:8531_t:CDS:10 [Diversispora eburnea]|uniref:8531_t:CDS:1 n=1 Tax=Diversispora eburnea TaxID=1213867 RepID=A0A9N8YKT1_9GLOM|nr:8531_t:CDS:10 [Diversispora eburnea]
MFSQDDLYSCVWVEQLIINVPHEKGDWQTEFQRINFESILSTDDLAHPTIDLYKFRHLCFHGVPDKPGIRQKSWKILLGYLPPDKRKWTKVLAEQRATYSSFVKDLLSDPGEEFKSDEHVDHPLNSEPNSKWNEYFADNIILEQIDKDVRRTLPDFSFFQLPVSRTPSNISSPKLEPFTSQNDTINRINRIRSLDNLDNNSSNDDDSIYSDSSNNTNSEFYSELETSIESSFPVTPATPLTPISTRRSIFKRVQHLNKDFKMRRYSSSGSSYKSTTTQDNDEEVDLHWEAIERILFIYAKLNPGVGYVQGMNEILGPVYFTMANDSEEDGKANAEADSFFIFTLMMSHVRDHFVRSLDMDGTTGIGHTMKKMNRPLHPTYYSFRWLTVMLSQEFALPDVIRLWDSIFSDYDVEEASSGFEFLIDFSCAMLICVKDRLLDGSFADNVKLLQNYPEIDLAILLIKAYELREHRLIANLNGEDFDAASDSDDDDYQSNKSGNVYYESSPIQQRVNDVKTKGMAMLMKVHEVINSKINNDNNHSNYNSDYNSDDNSDYNSDYNSDFNSDSEYNYNSDLKSNYNNYNNSTLDSNYNSTRDNNSNRFSFNKNSIGGNRFGSGGGMSRFAMRFSNVWRKNITVSS